jgi:hypothetical protein
MTNIMISDSIKVLCSNNMYNAEKKGVFTTVCYQEDWWCDDYSPEFWMMPF